MTNPLEKLRRFISKRTFLKHITVLAGGTAIGQLLSIVSLPLLTRLYTPEDFGKYALFIAFISISTVGASLMYETAIVAAKDDTEAAFLTVISVILAVLNTPLVTLGLYALIQFKLLGFASLPMSIVFWAICVFALTSIFQVLRYWLLRKQQFSLIAKVTVVQGGVRSISQVLLGMSLFTWLGLLIGDILGRIFGLGRMVKQTYFDVTQLIFPVNIQQLSKVAHKYLTFPLYSLPSSIINVLAFSLSIPVITQLYGTASGGYFLLAQRTLSIPMNLVSSSVADTFHSQIAYYTNNEPEKVKSFFLRTAKNLTLIGLFPTLTLAFFSPYLFIFIFGEAWNEVGWLVALMAPWTLVKSIVSPLSRIVFVLGGQRSKLVFDITALSSLFLVYYLGSHFRLSLKVTVGLMVFFNVVSYGIYFLVLLRVTQKNHQLKAVDTKKI